MSVLLITDGYAEEWVAVEELSAVTRAGPPPIDQIAAWMAMESTCEVGHEVGRALVAACPRQGKLTLLLARCHGAPVTNAAIARVIARLHAEMPVWLYVQTDRVAEPSRDSRWRRAIAELEQSLRLVRAVVVLVESIRSLTIERTG